MNSNKGFIEFRKIKISIILLSNLFDGLMATSVPVVMYTTFNVLYDIIYA